MYFFYVYPIAIIDPLTVYYNVCRYMCAPRSILHIML